MVLPTVGDLAPDFSLRNQANESVHLKDFRGKKIVLYFYPKADTPGCTVQACGIRDYAADFSQLNTRVLAVSPDLPAKLKKFDGKYDLGFDLLSDPDHSVAELYGVWGLKKFMGREFLGIIRTSFIIDETGHLLKIIEKVNTKTHNEDVISFIKTQF